MRKSIGIAGVMMFSMGVGGAGHRGGMLAGG